MGLRDFARKLFSGQPAQNPGMATDMRVRTAGLVEAGVHDDAHCFYAAHRKDDNTYMIVRHSRMENHDTLLRREFSQRYTLNEAVELLQSLEQTTRHSEHETDAQRQAYAAIRPNAVIQSLGHHFKRSYDQVSQDPEIMPGLLSNTPQELLEIHANAWNTVHSKIRLIQYNEHQAEMRAKFGPNGGVNPLRPS